MSTAEQMRQTSLAEASKRIVALEFENERLRDALKLIARRGGEAIHHPGAVAQKALDDAKD